MSQSHTTNKMAAQQLQRHTKNALAGGRARGEAFVKKKRATQMLNGVINQAQSRRSKYKTGAMLERPPSPRHLGMQRRSFVLIYVRTLVQDSHGHAARAEVGLLMQLHSRALSTEIDLSIFAKYTTDFIHTIYI